jgi:hypothetical protein
MKHIAIVLFLVLLSGSTKAQITITSGDFLSTYGQLNNHTSYSADTTVGLQALADLSGPAQTWNFTNLRWTQNVTFGETTTLLTYPGGAALADDPDFMAATNVIRSVSSDSIQDTVFEFVKLNSTGLWDLGTSEDKAGTVSKIIGYTPGWQLFQFPMTYGMSWQASTWADAPGFPAGTIYSISDTVVVDGYGTLITPPGQSNDALRVKKKETTAVTYSLSGLSEKTSAYSFNWYTKSGYSATINASATQNATDATYSVPANSSVPLIRSSMDDAFNLYLSQNPASNTETNLFYTLKNGGPVQVSMMDILGHNVHILQNGVALSGENVIPIDPRTLTGGTYFIRVVGEGMTAMSKLVIVR